MRNKSNVANREATMVTISRWSELTEQRKEELPTSLPSPTNQASPTFSSGKIINLYAALLHEPARRTKTRERRGETAEPTQKINPVRYKLTCSGDISEQKLHKYVAPAAAKLLHLLQLRI
jgi:hypothetical protein